MEKKNIEKVWIIKWKTKNTTSSEVKLEDTKGVIRSRKSKKNRQHNDQKKTTKEQTKIYKTLHRKTKIEQQEPYPKPGVHSCPPEG